MKFNNYLSLVSFVLTIQECSANMIDESGNGIIHKSRMRQRLLDDAYDNYGRYEHEGYEHVGDDDDSEYNRSYSPEVYFDLHAGYEHTCVVIITSDRRRNGLKCWGSNGSGQLGLGDTLPRGDQKGEMGNELPFVKIGHLTYRSYVTLGGFHTCVVFNKNKAKAKCFGDNRYGQLALGDTKNRGDEPNEMGDNLPYIDIGKPIDEIAPGLFHTCFHTEGFLGIACFGNNRYGQLGVGDMINRGGSPDHVGLNTLFADVKFEGEEYYAGWNHIFSGATANHTCIQSIATRLIKCWGGNTKGQLGLGDTNNRGDQPNEMGSNLPIIKLQKELWPYRAYVGGTNTCITACTDKRYGNDDSKQFAYCFGDNQYGQLGVGHTNNIGDDPNEMINNLKSTNLGHYKYAWDVSIGSSHICFIADGVAVKCYGQNSFGQLGQGDKINRGGSASTIGGKLPDIKLSTSGIKPRGVVAGNAHNCVHMIKKDISDAIKCFGNGSKGALGYEDAKNRGDEKNEMGDNLPRISLKNWAPSKSPTFKTTKKPTHKKA